MLARGMGFNLGLLLIAIPSMSAPSLSIFILAFLLGRTNFGWKLLWVVGVLIPLNGLRTITSCPLLFGSNSVFTREPCGSVAFTAKLGWAFVNVLGKAWQRRGLTALTDRWKWSVA